MTSKYNQTTQLLNKHKIRPIFTRLISTKMFILLLSIYLPMTLICTRWWNFVNKHFWFYQQHTFIRVNHFTFKSFFFCSYFLFDIWEVTDTKIRYDRIHSGFNNNTSEPPRFKHNIFCVALLSVEGPEPSQLSDSGF